MLAAAVIEYGTRRVRPYYLILPRRALRAAGGEGRLSEAELPNGDRLLTYSPPRESPKPKQ
ncbi:MAG TPA: hypothetical protein VFB66_08750 [Tepidisphaeraceae bacterium]|nr:hypothetical protein [Tepidisphaeraceae bacterium]